MLEKRKRGKKKDTLSLELNEENLEILNLYKQAYKRSYEDARLIEGELTGKADIKEVSLTKDQPAS